MKKTLLFLVAVVFGFAAMAQGVLKTNLKAEKAIVAEDIAFEPAKAYSLGVAQQPATPVRTFKNTDFVTVQNIGTSANAYGYGYAGGQKSLVNVNNDLNMVTNFHRMGGALDPAGYSGDLGYDVSVDGGVTWTNMVELYVCTENAGGTYYTDAARYPNHGVFNPIGNTDPNEAYVQFWAPNLDGSNGAGSWGGYSYGRAKIGDINDTTKNLKSTHGEFYQYIPDGYTLTNLGDVWCADLNQDWTSGAMVFMESMIMNHGVWDDAEKRFTYEEFLIDCNPLGGSADRPALQKIEFAPDGITGYVAVLSDFGDFPIVSGFSYYPILWKTEDGGESWSDPIPVALAGDEGIGAVQAFLTDDELGELFEPPIPDRDEIQFTTAFDFDLSVDAWGNPHIAVVCGITGSTAYSIITQVSAITGYQPTGAFLLSSFDGGDSWVGSECGRQKTFRGTFGDLTEDNRTQIARTPDGTKMFVTWLDTDLPGVVDNQQPDVWARGIDLITMSKTAVDGEDVPNNVTEFSEGMWQAYFQATCNEALVSGDTYTIPIVYEDMDPADPAVQVQFKYIQDFAYTSADFVIPGYEESDAIQHNTMVVGQSYPNPASGTTSVNVTLVENTTVSFEVFNMMGQKVYDIPATNMGAGLQTITFDASSLSNGVYFYTVTAGEESISKKMIVE
nr:T9SS type A sorting domain-containing protein [Bacteroidota bacterium]